MCIEGYVSWNLREQDKLKVKRGIYLTEDQIDFICKWLFQSWVKDMTPLDSALYSNIRDIIKTTQGDVS